MKLLLIGLITGIVFGFLLQQAKVVRYDKQIGALRFIDMTIVKFMLSSIIVGMVGIYLLNDLGLIELDIKATVLGTNIIGGLVFGIGWGLLGYCPGTQLGALGEGRWDAVFGILGMLAGGLVFAQFYSFLKHNIYTWGKFGEISLQDVTGIHHWIIIPVLIIGIAFLFRLLEKKNL